jgi:hypothetical protein
VRLTFAAAPRHAFLLRTTYCLLTLMFLLRHAQPKVQQLCAHAPRGRGSGKILGYEKLITMKDKDEGSVAEKQPGFCPVFAEVSRPCRKLIVDQLRQIISSCDSGLCGCMMTVPFHCTTTMHPGDSCYTVVLPVVGMRIYRPAHPRYTCLPGPRYVVLLHLSH